MVKVTKFEKETSAGGIVFRKRKRTGEIEVLLVKHSGHHGWGFPKGHIESGETPAFTAHREVEEEAGVKGEIIDKAGITTYFYVRDGVKVFKTVIYFLMKFKGFTKATHAWEVEDKKWVNAERVDKVLTFDDDKKMWQKAKANLKKLKS
ncbi:MAG: NUDIX domain-containing protein [Candidatus Bathyarchaeia archaeon]